VKDNGIGIPDDINIREANSLGLMLVSALITQMQASLELVKDNVTEFRIKFKERRFIR
jgi:two-component sensor histidine kinase